jgi:hypothetical protein
LTDAGNSILYARGGPRAVGQQQQLIGGFIQSTNPIYAPDALAQRFVRLTRERSAIEHIV